MAKKASTNTPAAEPEKANVRLDIDEKVEQRLIALYTLQCVDSKIDKIQIIRGELPQAIQDLEDEIAGLQTRIDNHNNAIKENEAAIARRKNEISEHQDNVASIEKKMENVKNNREYDSLEHELEFQNLEIELCERKNRESKAAIENLHSHIAAAQSLLEGRQADLQTKKNELESIIVETEKDEERLKAKSLEEEQFIEPHYLAAYKRIRQAAHNGLAVVSIDRAACGGCFSKIPLQRQTEIKMHKKVVVCEHCGRILVDDALAKIVNEKLEK